MGLCILVSEMELMGLQYQMLKAHLKAITLAFSKLCWQGPQQ